MDVKSAAKYWLVNAFAMNSVAYNTGSTYIYKVRDADGKTGKLYWGPLWDFDFTWNFRLITSGFDVSHEWLLPMFCDRGKGGFVEEVKAQWKVMRPAIVELVRDGGVIDQYAAETKASAEQDHRLFHGADEAYSYLDDVEKLKAWIRDRLAWVDENIAQVENLAHEVTYLVDGEAYALDFKETGAALGKTAAPEKAGYVFLGWVGPDGSLADEETKVARDMTLTASYIPEGEATHAADIAFRKSCDVVRYNVHVYRYAIDYKVIPRDAQDQTVRWSSSDESYATVDAEGVVTYNGVGEVTLTAKLNNGVSRSFTLSVTEDEPPVPEAILPNRDMVRMRAGEQSVLAVTTRPSPAWIDGYTYASGDEAVVTVDDYGVLKAVGAGETTVRVTAAPAGNAQAGERAPETEVAVVVLPFADVPGDAWFYDAVRHCCGRNYFKGESDALFAPGETMTRAMFATVLYRMAGEPAAVGENPFTDVKDGRWYTDAVIWAAGRGLIAGYGDGRFGPGDPVTREQMAAIFWRYNGAPAGTGGLSGFRDAGSVSGWAKGAFAWAVSAGVISGRGDGILDPAGAAARAEVAQIVMNYDAGEG